jgi:hypothetical protein
MTRDQRVPNETPQPPTPPRVVAVAGVLFSALFIIGLVLIRLAIPADPTDSGEWVTDAGVRDSVRLALNLIPFTGIAFLWFMGVLRNRIGLLEDRFFATVFLGSGLLFVAMLFVAAAISGAMLEGLASEGRLAAHTFAFGRRASYALMNVYAIKMAAVFVFVTSMIGLRTAFLPRWLALVGFAVGVVLLVVITNFAWIALLLPLWVLLLSGQILVTDFGRRHPIAGSTAACGEPNSLSSPGS